MKRRIAISLAAVFCCCIGSNLLAQGDGDASSKLQQLEKDMRQAQMKNDVSWYQEHLADGYVEGHSWGEWATKDEAIKEAQNKEIKFTKGEVSDIKVATYGDSTAIARYTFTYDATMKGTHRARSVICSDTWVNQSGTWKIISAHCSHVEGKK